VSYGIGDRVETPHGPGAITKIYRGMADVTLDRMTSEGSRYYTMCLPVACGMSDLERVMKHYASDQDAGHEEPWDAITDTMKTLYPQHPAWSQPRAIQQSDTIEWGAERNLYSRQLQDANKRILELEKNLAEANGYIIKNGERISELYAENQKLREQLKAQASGQTVSVPLSAWNKLCAEAAKARPLAEEEPEAFPARALRWSV